MRDTNKEAGPQNENDYLGSIHEDRDAAAQLGQFAIHPPRELVQSSTPSSDHIQPISQTPHIVTDASARLYRSNETRQSPVERLSHDVYPEDISAAYPNDSDLHTSKEFPGPSGSLDSEIRNFQPEMTMAEAPDVALEFDPALFDQSMLSTINWLPSELLSSAYSQAPQSISVSSQYNQSVNPHAYCSRPAGQPPVINTGQISPVHAESISQIPPLQAALEVNLENPNQSPHAMSEPSQAESVDSAKRSADYYVDGAGARLPKYRKKIKPWARSPADLVDFGKRLIAEDSGHRFNFPSISEVRIDRMSEDINRFAQRIEVSTYDEIRRNFVQLCCSENPFFEKFESEGFPNIEECNVFIGLFFDSFQVVYPILHLSTFDPNACHWLLTLSIVALGCHVSHIFEMEECTTALHELIRRGIHVEVKNTCPIYISLFFELMTSHH